jgi:hypothetical protein
VHEPFFRGESWDTWRSVVKAAFAEPLSESELELFRSVANREPPRKRVKELVAAVGRGCSGRKNERQNAKDEGKRRHEDWPEPYPRGTASRIGLPSRMRCSRATSTINMPFFAERAIKSMSPI